MRGRRPKPTRLKVLTGNPGKRPLNGNEPRPAAAVPECPAELGPVARTEWNRLVGELSALRLLTNLDRAALAAYCGAYALWAEATEAIQKFGAMVKSPTGYPMQSPYISIANRQAEIMMRIPDTEVSHHRDRQFHPSCKLPTVCGPVLSKNVIGALQAGGMRSRPDQIIQRIPARVLDQSRR